MAALSLIIAPAGYGNLQNDLHGAEEHFKAVVESVDSAHALAYTAADQPLAGFAARVYNTIMLKNQAPVRQASAKQERPIHAAATNILVTRAAARANFGATDGPHPAAARRPSESDLQELLSYREMDVLRMLEQRLTNKEIAHMLGISTETVRQHTVNLFRKLNVNNRRQVIVAARNPGGLAVLATAEGHLEQ